MSKFINLLLFGISTLILGFTLFIGGTALFYDNYDYRQAGVKIIGKFGHGSGVVIESTITKSLILTNKHVCEGITVDPFLTAKIDILTVVQENPDIVKEERFIFLMMMLGIEYTEKQLSDSNFIQKELITLKNMIKIQQKEKFDIYFNMDVKHKLKGHAKIVGVKLDLCIVSVDVGNLPIVRLAEKDAKSGDKVYAHGNPLFMDNHITDGYVGNTMVYEDVTYMHQTAPIYAGSSGSGVFNMDGELVGITTLGVEGVPTAGYMIQLHDIKGFLKFNTIMGRL